MEFDEYIQLSQVREQVLVSPPLAKGPGLSLKGGKTLIIDLGTAPLLENKTYTINLGTAVKDNNEGNPLVENVFLFSTGDFIDSLDIKGEALLSQYQEPCKDCIMLAFPEGTDSISLGRRPQYIARCDGSGDFQFSHMASGEYELIALLDRNTNLKVDKGESFGFLLSSVKAGQADSTLLMQVGPMLPEGHSLKRAEWATDGRSVLLTSRGSYDSLIFSWPGAKIPVYTQSSNRPDSVRYWFDGAMTAGDLSIITSSTGIADTVKVGRVTENLNAWGPMNPNLEYAADTLKAKLDRPVSFRDSTRILLLQDSLGIPFKLLGSNPMQLEMTADWQYGAAYTVIFMDSSLTDIYGNASDSIQYSFRIPTKESLAELTLDIQLEAGSYLIYLLDKDKKVKAMTRALGSMKWKLPPMTPAEMRLWVVKDENGDGYWTSGSYDKMLLPEPVYLQSESIKMRSNWEMELQVVPVFSR